MDDNIRFSQRGYNPRGDINQQRPRQPSITVAGTGAPYSSMTPQRYYMTPPQGSHPSINQSLPQLHNRSGQYSVPQNRVPAPGNANTTDFVNQNTKNPGFSSYNARVSSYGHFPVYLTQTPETIGKCRFFLQPVFPTKATGMRLFAINVVLHLKNGGPMMTHGSSISGGSDGCDYVRLVKGDQYIQRVRLDYGRATRISTAKVHLNCSKTTHSLNQVLNIEVSRHSPMNQHRAQQLLLTNPSMQTIQPKSKGLKPLKVSLKTWNKHLMSSQKQAFITLAVVTGFNVFNVMDNCMTGRKGIDHGSKHARLFPNCAFVKEQLGEGFIETIKVLYKDLEETEKQQPEQTCHSDIINDYETSDRYKALRQGFCSSDDDVLFLNAAYFNWHHHIKKKQDEKPDVEVIYEFFEDIKSEIRTGKSMLQSYKSYHRNFRERK